MSAEIVSLMPELFGIMEEVRKEEAQKPGRVHLLGSFRHQYENSHSEIIASLLDPKGSHKHGEEFLQMFLNQVVFESKKDELEKIKDLNSTRVTTEFFIHDGKNNGRIDILLQHDNFTVIIENKIWAKDQANQLRRYYDAIIDNEDVVENNIHVVYLTPDEKYPSDYSFGKNYKREETLREKLICISYKTHIIKWLDDINKKLYYCKEPLLKSGVEQYLYAVKVITNQLEEDNAMKDKLFQKLVANMDSCSMGDLQNLNESISIAKAFWPIFEVYKHFKKKMDDPSKLYFTAGSEGTGEKRIEIAEFTTNLCKDEFSLYIISDKIHIAFWKGIGKQGVYYALQISNLSSFSEDVQKKMKNMVFDKKEDIWGESKDKFQAGQYRSKNIDEDAISKTITKIEKLIEYSLKN